MGHVEMGAVTAYVNCLKPGPKFVLAMLADRAEPKEWRDDDKVECWPSVQELVQRTAQSKSTVLRQLAQLEALGIISVEHRWIKDENGQARQTSNLYVIDLPAILAGKFKNRPSASKGVKMTPKPSSGKTPVQAKGVKMTSKESLSVKNPHSKSVNSDTPKNININITPPSPPPSATINPEVQLSTPSTSADRRGRQAASDEPGAGLENFPQSLDQSPDRFSADLRPRNTSDSAGNAVKAKNPSGEQMSASGDDWGLIGQCLPELMQSVPPRDVSQIAKLLRQRLAAGWQPEQIRGVLGARALPSRVRTLTGLVKARLRDDVPVSDVPPRARRSMTGCRGESSVIARVRHEFVCDQKAGAAVAVAGFDAWLASTYPDLVDSLQ